MQDFDLDTTHQITNSPKDLIVRWARDSGTIKPAAIHNGEGVCHWFHMTANGRGAAMVLIITGNVGKFGPAAIPGPATTRPERCMATPWSGYGINAVQRARIRSS